MATTTTANTFLQRLIGAAALDAAIYEEVEADAGATGQALMVVLISSLAAAVGVRGFAGETGVNVAVLSVAGLLSWACWALLTYEIGVRFMPEPQTRGSVGENLRTIGFSAAPGLLLVFGILPGLTTPVFLGTSAWMVAAMVVAVRQALDYRSTSRAVAVCVVGGFLALAFALGVGLMFGPTVE